MSSLITHRHFNRFAVIAALSVSMLATSGCGLLGNDEAEKNDKTSDTTSETTAKPEESGPLAALAALGKQLGNDDTQKSDEQTGTSDQPAESDNKVTGALGALGALAAMGQKMEAAGNQMEQAKASGDQQAQGQAMAAMMGVMMGGKDGKVEASLSADQLKAFLPEALGDLQRVSLSASRNAAMGMQITEASADYENTDNSQRVSINLSDNPATSGLMAMAGAFGGAGESESQTADGYEKTYTLDGHRIHEKWNKNSQRGEYSISIGNRFQVEASGKVESMDQLKGIVGSLDLMGLAALKNAGAQPSTKQ